MALTIRCLFVLIAFLRDLRGPLSIPRNHGCIALFFPSAGHSLGSGCLRYPVAGQGDLEGLSGRVPYDTLSFCIDCPLS